MSGAQHDTDDSAQLDDPVSPTELTAFQQSILSILAEESRYGLAVKRELQSYYGEEINHGRLYPNLDDLADLGLIEVSELDKRTNEYAITTEGRAVIRDLMQWHLARLEGSKGVPAYAGP